MGAPNNVPEVKMLEMRQISAVWNVTIMVVLDDLSQKAGLSKVGTMARVIDSALYESRGDLAPVTLKNSCATWLRWFENQIEERYEATGGGLEIIADVLQKEFEDPKCFDFASMNIAQDREFENGQFVAAGEQKDHLRRYLERLAVRMGLQHPDNAASAAVLVIERTIAWTDMTGSPKEAQTARLLFQCLQHA